MTEPTSPTTPERSELLRLAEPGELRGVNLPNVLSPTYRAAMDLAITHPTSPVLVESFDPADATDDSVNEAKAEAQRASKAAMRTVNAYDHDEGNDPEVERFHVGYSAPAPGKSAFLVFIVFYPDGRPKRKRGAADEGGGDAGGADDAPPADAAD